MKIKSITVIARRWLQKTYGNTYHSCEVLVNGKFVAKNAFTYGYGSHYLQTALELLKSQGYLKDINKYPNGNEEALWRYCDRKKIELHENVTDVTRKKDL